eukprot:2443435-Amphidinium_carterae.1
MRCTTPRLAEIPMRNQLSKPIFENQDQGFYTFWMRLQSMYSKPSPSYLHATRLRRHLSAFYACMQ